MSGYNCTIEYIAGTTNTCADLLSRHPELDFRWSELWRSCRSDCPWCRWQFVWDQYTWFHSVWTKVICKFYLPNDESFEKCDCSDFRKGGFDMKVEQTRDNDISEIWSMILNGKESKDVQKHYLFVDVLVYYLSNVDDDLCLRLFIPNHTRNFDVKQYHDQNEHMGVQKTLHSIHQKYYWPNLFKKINNYVSECTVCQIRSLQKIRPPLQETDIPLYSMGKLSFDLSGPYPTSLSGNKYITVFVDWYSGWPEAFAVPDKTADTEANLIIEQIYPRFGCPLQIVSDNRVENVNKVLKETLGNLRYIMFWQVYIILRAMPIDNILQSRRKYAGEE